MWCCIVQRSGRDFGWILTSSAEARSDAGGECVCPCVLDGEGQFFMALAMAPAYSPVTQLNVDNGVGYAIV